MLANAITRPKADSCPSLQGLIDLNSCFCGSDRDYEIERLIEIYSLIQPSSRVTIFLTVVSAERAKPPQQLNPDKPLDSCQHRFATGFSIYPVSRPTDVDHLAFLISYVSDDPPRPTSSRDTPRRAVLKVADLVATRLPLVYETFVYCKRRTADLLASHKADVSPAIETSQLNDRTHTSSDPLQAFIGMHWLAVGGAEAFAQDSACLLHDLGFRVTVIAKYISIPFYRRRLSLVLKVYEIERQVPSGRGDDFICKLIERERPCLIHNHHNPDFYKIFSRAREAVHPLLIIDSLHIVERPRYNFGYPALSSANSHLIDLHHTISRKLGAFLSKNGVAEDKIGLGYLSKSLTLPQKFNIDDISTKRSITISFVARMVTQKRPILSATMILDALAQIDRLGFFGKAIIAGEGNLLHIVKKIVSGSKFLNQVEFLPSKANVVDIFNRSDILLIPSENEGITLTAYEAISAGCLAVSTGVGGQSELITHQCLLSVNPLIAPFQWRSLLIKLIRNPVYRKDVMQGQLDMAHKVITSRSASQLLRPFYIRAAQDSNRPA